MFSCAVGREGRCRQMSLTCVGRTRSVAATLGFPLLSGVCAFPVYTAQAPCCSIGNGPCVACGSSFRVLHKSADSAGPAFCAFPGRNSSGSQELDEHILPWCSAPYPLCGSSLSFCACTGLVHLVSVLGSWSLAATLPVDVNHPESQEVFG